MTTSPPIACTLTPSAYAERVGWMGQINEASLRSYRQEGLVLELVYEPGALQRLSDLVRREQDCCAFLRFMLEERPGAVHLRIEAPPAAGNAAALLFAPFLTSAPPGMRSPDATRRCRAPR